MDSPNPLVTFSLDSIPNGPNRSSPPSSSKSSTERPRQPWYHYAPLFGTILLILSPHPSLLYVLVTFHLQILHQPLLFMTHLTTTYTLTFLALSSLIVCVARDPGPVTTVQHHEDDETDITAALMTDYDPDAPGRWCRKCWAPKPERAHHCSTCGRCVLKMGESSTGIAWVRMLNGSSLLLDHHCPWLGSKCIGHRTYPAFFHFLLSVTLLALYIAIISILGLVYAFNNPYTINSDTPIHELFLAAIGIIFSMVIGSFFAYHVYLVLTNQTTLENISPFLLLKHLPKLPQTAHDLSDPPLEPELNRPQRRLVKDAHGSIHMYDIGWRNNWAQVFGFKNWTGLLVRFWCGGASPGDGKYFPRNPRAEGMLARLATELVKIDRDG